MRRRLDIWAVSGLGDKFWAMKSESHFSIYMGRQAKRLDGHSSYRRGVLRGVTVGIAISTVKSPSGVLFGENGFGT